MNGYKDCIIPSASVCVRVYYRIFWKYDARRMSSVKKSCRCISLLSWNNRLCHIAAKPHYHHRRARAIFILEWGKIIDRQARIIRIFAGNGQCFFYHIGVEQEHIPNTHTAQRGTENSDIFCIDRITG